MRPISPELPKITVNGHWLFSASPFVHASNCQSI
jgi:hypothetical protein